MNKGQEDFSGTFATPRTAAYYGYNNDQVVRSKMPLLSEEPENPTRRSIDFHEPVPPTMDCPMPADRLARKQRSFGRRGGVCQSVLQKSAVIASISLLGDADEEELLTDRCAASAHERTPDKQTSPRKRARHFSEKETSEDKSIEKASKLMETLSVLLREEEEVSDRRVSRRTSYDSRVSDGAES